MIHRGNTRVSILTPRIIRIEHDPSRRFEDRPSQHFWNRRLPVPAFSVADDGGFLCIETGNIRLRIPLDGIPTPENVRVVGEEPVPVSSGETGNLGGCLRTLDTVRGRWNYKEGRFVAPGPGLMSRVGWTSIDDSAGLVFDTNGFLTPREHGTSDWYIFACGRDFAGALRDYHAVAGAPPLIPRWALGIWWSKWEAYRQADLERIVSDFDAHGVPLSVCVVDMDWHMPGWTGYTWNKDFFPDPRAFFDGLHQRGVHACLNLHPSGGIKHHEAAYEKMARHMGIDPAGKEPVAFDITNPHFIDGYFRHVHHPLEEDGVDFWWMDWQQGEQTALPGLDPLWYLNHLHATDLARDGRRRPLAFSRWGGWGAHRYPVGFSGDSSRTWDTLAFEIELTAQSANTGFGWWSHDIGGFCDGFPDDELYTRWVQFGVLSPVFRFHNCGDPTLDYRPWTKEEKFRGAALDALRLRRSLEPYLYTAARRNHEGEPPPCVPVYYGWPDDEAAYHCPGQYLFGPSLLAAPHDSPADRETNLSRKVVWLPPGDWYDFHDGAHFTGGNWTAIHGGIGGIPLFARAGSAVPAKCADVIEWLVFPGEGTSQFYDDDGESLDYRRGACASVTLAQSWADPTRFRLRLRREGDARFGTGPFRIRLRGFAGAGLQSVTTDSGAQVRFGRDGGDWVIADVPQSESVTLTCGFDDRPANKPRWTSGRFWHLVENFHVNCHAIRQMKESGLDFAGDLQRMAPYRHEFTAAQMRVLVEEALGCGLHWWKESGTRDVLVWWNHSRRPEFTVRFSRSIEWLGYGEIFDRGDSAGQLHILEHKDAQRGWCARVNYAELAFIETGNEKTGRAEATR